MEAQYILTTQLKVLNFSSPVVNFDERLIGDGFAHPGALNEKYNFLVLPHICDGICYPAIVTPNPICRKIATELLDLINVPLIWMITVCKGKIMSNKCTGNIETISMVARVLNKRIEV